MFTSAGRSRKKLTEGQTCLCVSACVCAYWGPLTDVAVLSRPALVALTLALLADAILAAQRVTGLLVAHASCPALLAATHTAVADAVAAAVHLAHLCRSGDTHAHRCVHKLPITHRKHTGQAAGPLWLRPISHTRKPGMLFMLFMIRHGAPCC